jgi:arsenate reductase
MEEATIYHYASCGKSRETLGLLNALTNQVRIIEYLKTPPTAVELEKLIAMLGIPAMDLIRKGEPVFKENFKNQVLTDAQAIEAMVDYPILIERPIVVRGNKAVIGRPPKNVELLFEK